MVHRRTNALQLLAVALALSSALAQRNEGAATSRAGNNWDNFRIFGRGKIVAVNPDVERLQQQKQRLVPARTRPAPPPPPPPRIPRVKATIRLRDPLPQSAVPANTVAEADNEVSVGRVEVPALRKKVETVLKKAEEAAEIHQEGDEAANRAGKSLANTFPFNQRNGEGHHGHHGHHNQGLVPPPPPTQSFRAPASSRFDNRGSRQDTRVQGGDVALDIGTIAAAGERCIDKVVMVEETEFDTQIDCKHSYKERCFTTYKTDYTPVQEEECDENFRKDCFIEFKPRAIEEKVQQCITPLVRNCNLPSPTECSTEYRSECTTRYHEHDVEDDIVECEDIQEEKCEDVTQGYSTQQKCTKWPRRVCASSTQRVKKFTPETNCRKRPVEICGPGLCPVEAGPEECYDKKETIVQDEPEEVCNLEPQVECKHVTKLVPLLKPHEDCVDIPSEVCSRSFRNPRKVQKPIVKKWCYTPSPESGLGFGTGLGNPNQGAGRPRPTPQRPQRPTQRCSSQCQRNNRNGQCSPQCNISECPPCTPRCPSQCERKIRNGQCTPECNLPECPRCTPPVAAPPQCPRQCERNNRNGQCSPRCNLPECPPCTPPRAPPKTCPRQCERNNRNGQCSPQCDIPECPRCVPPAPTCPRQCERKIRNGQCTPECNIPECPRCVPPKQCSRRCVQNIAVGQCSPECNVPECPKCTPPPPPTLYDAPPKGYGRSQG